MWSNLDVTRGFLEDNGDEDHQRYCTDVPITLRRWRTKHTLFVNMQTNCEGMYAYAQPREWQEGAARLPCLPSPIPRTAVSIATVSIHFVNLWNFQCRLPVKRTGASVGILHHMVIDRIVE